MHIEWESGCNFINSAHDDTKFSAPVQKRLFFHKLQIKLQPVTHGSLWNKTSGLHTLYIELRQKATQDLDFFLLRVNIFKGSYITNHINKSPVVHFLPVTIVHKQEKLPIYF